MKKIAIFSAALALCCSVNAASVRVIDFGNASLPNQAIMLSGLGISANGRYVCGPAVMGSAYFIFDQQTDEYLFEFTTDDVEGSLISHISNNGYAVGFDGPGFMVSFDSTEYFKTPDDELYKYVLAEDITNDADMVVGTLISRQYTSEAGYMTAPDYEWHKLPQPTAEQIGGLVKSGTTAKFVSGDGALIAGNLPNFGSAIIWTLDDSGNYVIDPLLVRYLLNPDPEFPYAFKSFVAQEVSNNGKYVLVKAALTQSDNTVRIVPCVFEVETGDLKVYDDVQEIDDLGIGLTPTAISDNGTIVGYIGEFMYNTGGFILYPDKTQAQRLVDAFPACADVIGVMDQTNSTIPAGISADGRYIAGYGFQMIDPDAAQPELYYATFVLDTSKDGDDNAVETIGQTPAGVAEYYSVDGVRRNGPAKGLNIVRNADGTVSKILR